VLGTLTKTIFVGKLPTNAGWQPALPGIYASSAGPERRSSLAFRLIA
jgi:hypothetical protein